MATAKLWPIVFREQVAVVFSPCISFSLSLSRSPISLLTLFSFLLIFLFYFNGQKNTEIFDRNIHLVMFFFIVSLFSDTSDDYLQQNTVMREALVQQTLKSARFGGGGYGVKEDVSMFMNHFPPWSGRKPGGVGGACVPCIGIYLV